MEPTRTLRSDDGTELAAYDLGGSGPALLLAHATGFHAAVLGPLVAQLRDAYHCYSFDERGHGASPAPPGTDFDWHRFGDDARAVAGAFGLGRPLTFGHSCGGALLLLAEMDHPGSWRGVYTFEPVVPSPGMFDAGPSEDLASNPLAAGALRRRAEFPDRRAAYDNFASKPPLDVLAPAALEAYVEHGFVDTPGGVTLACRPESEAATYAAGVRHRAWDRLGELACPVVVACGGESTHFSPAHCAAVADRIPAGRLEVLPGLGHFGPLEDPPAVAASVRDALAAF